MALKPLRILLCVAILASLPKFNYAEHGHLGVSLVNANTHEACVGRIETGAESPNAFPDIILQTRSPQENTTWSTIMRIQKSGYTPDYIFATGSKYGIGFCSAKKIYCHAMPDRSRHGLQGFSCLRLHSNNSASEPEEELISHVDLPLISEVIVGSSYFIQIDEYCTNIYWTTLGGKLIFLTNLKTLTSTVIGAENSRILQMAVDTSRGIVFWANEGRKIHKRIFDGTKWSQQEIGEWSSSWNLTSLAVDIKNQYLYWTTSVAISRTSFSGDGKVDTYTSSLTRGLCQIQALKVSNGNIYLLRKIAPYGYISKFDWSSSTQIAKSFLAVDLEMYNVMEIVENRPVFKTQNPCKACANLCLLNSAGSYQCECPPQMKKSSRGCVSLPFLVITGSFNGTSRTELSQMTVYSSRTRKSTRLNSYTKYANLTDIIASEDTSTFCHRCNLDAKSHEYCCHVNETISHTMVAPVLPNSIVLISSLSPDGKKGRFLWADPTDHCVYKQSLGDITSTEIFCSDDLDPNYVAIDSSKYTILWRHTGSNKLVRSFFPSQEHLTMGDGIKGEGFVDSDSNHFAGSAPLMCADSSTSELFWLSGNKIRWVKYKGGLVYFFQLPLDTFRVHKLQCHNGRVYWIHEREKDPLRADGKFSIMMLDPDTYTAYPLYIAESSDAILAFTIGSKWLDEGGMSEGKGGASADGGDQKEKGEDSKTVESSNVLLTIFIVANVILLVVVMVIAVGVFFKRRRTERRVRFQNRVYFSTTTEENIE